MTPRVGEGAARIPTPDPRSPATSDQTQKEGTPGASWHPGFSKVSMFPHVPATSAPWLLVQVPETLESSFPGSLGN